MAAALSALNSQAEVSNRQTPPQTTTATSTSTIAPIYSTTPPIPTAVQDGSASGFPKGWNPMIGYGMPPDFFTTPSRTQFNASTTQPMTSHPGQQNAQGTWSPQMAAQSNAQFNSSVSQPMAPQHDPSATQPMNSQQDASATPLTAQGTWSPQMAVQFNASAPPPMTLQ